MEKAEKAFLQAVGDLDYTERYWNHTWDGKGKNFLTKNVMLNHKVKTFQETIDPWIGDCWFWDTWFPHIVRLMVELAEAQGQAQEADLWGFYMGKRHAFGVKPWGKTPWFKWWWQISGRNEPNYKRMQVTQCQLTIIWQRTIHRCRIFMDPYGYYTYILIYIYTYTFREIVYIFTY